MLNRRFGVSLALALCLVSSAVAQTGFPSRSIRIVVPTTAGSGSDSVSRLLAAKLKETAGWDVVVENRLGGSGTVGLAETIRARADGHEWVVGLSTNVTLAPSVMKLSFDPMADLTPVAYLADTPLMLTVATDSPYATWQEFAAAAKSGDGLTYGSFGAGSSAHVAGELLRMQAGVKLRHVPYKGSTLALTDLVGGHVDSAIVSPSSALALLQSGRVRPLAVTTTQRSSSLPTVPTFAELGLRTFNRPEWYGIFVRTAVPTPVIERINEEVNRVLRMPEVRAAILAQGQEPRVERRSAFQAMVQADYLSAREIIAKAQIRAD